MYSSLSLDEFRGLTESAAGSRLKADGYNELPSVMKRSGLSAAFEVLKEPMFLLLIACGLLYVFLGEPREAVMLLCFVCLIMGISIYQEGKTDRALEALRDLSSPRALLIRDGKSKRVAGREVVREDIIVLAEGDRVPADAEILRSINLLIDESLLTGESVPVHKSPAGENCFTYSGSLVVRGQGIARVFATGANTELGKIGKSLQTMGEPPSALEKQTEKLVRGIAIIGLCICALLVVIYGFTRFDSLHPYKSWIGGVLAGIALAMALLPEEFPVILSVFLALGAWRMSKKNVLTRKPAAIESLGSSTVLCVDKTGTLTQNRMTVAKIYSGGSYFSPLFQSPAAELPENFHRLVEYSILASQKSPFDPMEIAIRELGEFKLQNTEHIHEDWELVQEYPLSEDLMAMSNVWQMPGKNIMMIAAKGSPEAVLDLCHVNESMKDNMLSRVMEMADEGFRVLGVARSSNYGSELPEIQHDFDFEFLGLVGLFDPVRPSAAPAIGECGRAGIRVVMITGDYPGTARNIAERIGITDSPGLITGPEIAGIGEKELSDRIRRACIFARVVPEQKLSIVNALKGLGEVVAMTGDGVNDAPALKAAHVGIAMGLRGTDVAREASDIVLLDDDFSSVVSAVKMGRRIFDNIQKAMTYVISIHVPIAGMALLPVLFNAPLILLPVHIVFLEMIIDPACSVVFEAESEEPGIMDRPPRKLERPLIGRHEIFISVVQGLFVLMLSLSSYLLSSAGNLGESHSRTAAFTTLIFANLGLILSGRSWKLSILKSLGVKNAALWWVVSGSLFFLLVVLYIPALRDIFHFDVLTPSDLLTSLAGGVIGVILFEAFKLFNRRKKLMDKAI